MLRLVLQRFALRRSVAEQLEAVPLDEVLRRMQSSSLTNPARSLESHFVLAQPPAAAQSSSASPSSSSASSSGSSPGRLLRQALSERLLAEVRHDVTTPHLTLDVGSLMLANCLRHELTPQATQQIFALWMRSMRHGTGARASASFSSSSIGSLSMLRLGRRGAGPGSGGSAQSHQLLQFQSLVRVLEACLDAQEQHCSSSASSEDREGVSAATAASPQPVCLSLDDLAELVDTVEQYWPLFADLGASTAGLLVQFTALALELTSSASSTAAAVDPESRLTNSLRRLSHLQTDRTLLQTRVLGLCAEAVKSLCALESSKDAEDGDTAMYCRSGPWWHRPQELVRLSQARRRIEAYETREPRKAERFSKSLPDCGAREHACAEAGFSHDTVSSGKAERAREKSGTALRVTRVGSHTRPASTSQLYSSSSASTALSAPAATSRWVPLLSSSWWPSASSLSGAGATASSGAATQRAGGLSARVAKELGGYVTRHALQQTTNTTQAASRSGSTEPGCDSPRRPGTSSASTSLSPALLAVSLKDVFEIFSTVCATASSGDALGHVTAFAWWVRDVVYHQRGRRSLHDERELASLLSIAELCLAYPDGTQTVLAEIMKALQSSTLFLWQVGDVGAGSPHFQATRLSVRDSLHLWPRACEAVAGALPLTTVGTEADRTLRALVSTAQQALSSSEVEPTTGDNAAPDRQLLVRYRRYGLLILACLLLQRPNGYVTPTFAGHIRKLVWTVPFLDASGGPNDLAAAVRALYLFTHLEATPSQPSRRSYTQQTEEVVSYLLDQVTGLLTASAGAEAGEAERDATESLSRSLSSLSATERQLLRSAMRAVREKAAKVKADLPPVTKDSAFSATLRAPEEAASSCRREADVTKGSASSHTAVASPRKPFSRSATPQKAAPSAPPQQTRSRKASPDHERSHLLYEQRVLQREVDAVSRHFRAQPSTL